MLITLQSNSNADASQFVNFFKETVQIQPDSEIALVQVSYEFPDPAPGTREADILVVMVDQFEIKSICKNGGVQKAVGVTPYGNPMVDNDFGRFIYTKEFPQYMGLGNKVVENHNQIRVRLTNAVGEPLENLVHPTTITLDVRPRAK